MDTKTLSPSVTADPFTTSIPKLESVTGRYSFISTARFIEDMQSLGFTLEATRQPRRGLGMHSMTFSHASLPTLEGLRMHFLATNSHDGTSAFNLYVKVEVQVCSNGLVAFVDDTGASSRIVHRGYTIDKVRQAIDAVQSRVASVISQVQLMQSKDVTPADRASFLMKAQTLRDSRPYNLIDLIDVQHTEQSRDTVWNVFNRVQERLIRGGYKTAESYIGAGTGTTIIVPGRRAKEVTSVKDRLRINRQLWQLAVDELLNKTA